MSDPVSCPSNPPAPDGYQIWKGPVPTEITQWAMQLRDNLAPFPYGQTWTLDYTDSNGNPATVLARKDHHTFTWRPGVGLVTGICIMGVTAYAPIPGGSPGTAEVAAVAGDPLASPDGTEAVWGADTDPNDATSAPPTSTSWGLVALCAGALAATVTLVVGGIKMAGRAAA